MLDLFEAQKSLCWMLPKAHKHFFYHNSGRITSNVVTLGEM